MNYYYPCCFRPSVSLCQKYIMNYSVLRRVVEKIFARLRLLLCMEFLQHVKKADSRTFSLCALFVHVLRVAGISCGERPAFMSRH